MDYIFLREWFYDDIVPGTGVHGHGKGKKARKCLRDWIQGNIAEKKLSYFRKNQIAADKIVNSFSYDPYGIRTRVTAVKGRCLNRLTNGPIYGGEGGI